MKKPKYKEIREVQASDISKALPDLHYRPIATLTADDAALIALGYLDEYEALTTLTLSPRRRGKIYLRAGANYNAATLELLRVNDPEYFEQLQHAREKLLAVINKSKVTFTKELEVFLPTNCLVGSCYVDFDLRAPRVWRITRPVLLDKFYQVPGRGGFYFLREVT